ncbi:MAG TPA: rhodanese-like domain-containing protein, partial [Phycisphaerales bacterium]|nr:rhodanese-like domain-containing protein [Phycisphaerales bacterium]
MTAATSPIREISPTDLKTGLERREIALIDVREPVEHAGERIAGAHLMPLGTFDPAKAREIATSRMLVLHCKGGSRSSKAAQAMLNAGEPSITHLSGGI